VRSEQGEGQPNVARAALMLSWDPTLAAGAHEPVMEAEEAIRAGQQWVRAALQRMRVTSDILNAGSLDLPGPHARPTAGRVPRGREALTLAACTRWRPPATMGPGNEMADLIRCLSGAQANDSGWPVFKGKYVEYPRFRKGWWAYRRTYHGHIRDKLVGRALKEKSLMESARAMINDMEDLQKIWDTLDTCFDRPEKYIAEALDPIIKFRKYRAFDSEPIREFYSLLRAAMLGARKVGILHRLINDQTLPGIMSQMPLGD
jgi:hypothetical protein